VNFPLVAPVEVEPDVEPDFAEVDFDVFFWTFFALVAEDFLVLLVDREFAGFRLDVFVEVTSSSTSPSFSGLESAVPDAVAVLAGAVGSVLAAAR